MTSEKIEIAGEDIPSVCPAHAGMVVWIKLGCALLTVLVGLFAYSAFIQVPEIKLMIRDQIHTTDLRIAVIERDIQLIKVRTNYDHPKSQPLR
jgi:hypothetical protein